MAPANAPWLDPLRDTMALIGQLSEGADTHWTALADQLAQRRSLTNAAGQSIRFAAQQLNIKQNYELGIAQSGIVTCRTQAAGFASAEEQHDWYNALIWLSFPRCKSYLNQLQSVAQLSQAANQDRVGERGALRDAVTVFDENALILCHDNADIVNAIKLKQWTAALHDARSQWGRSIRPIIFGHALLQKLDQPFKAITAHAYVLPINSADLVDLSLPLCDERLWLSLQGAALQTKPFLPLPVMGIPGWSCANGDVSFYDDPKIFRV